MSGQAVCLLSELVSWAGKNGDKMNLSDKQCWYGIHTKSRQEDRVDNNLKTWEVETFSPKLKEISVNQYTGRQKYLIKPLFPSYIFARFSATDSLHKVCFTRGVHSVVSFAGQPCVVEDAVIKLIQEREDDEGWIQLSDKLRPGDKVIIRAGLFKDLVGILEEGHTDSERISILLGAVSYQSRVVIDRTLAMKTG
jgi:transcription elongation factor/antiterminator RfaH